MERTVHNTLAAVEDEHWWWQTRREIISDLICAYAPRSSGGLRLAELGCGHGGNLEMLSRFGEVLGAEADAETYSALRLLRGSSHRVIRHQIPEPLPERFHVIGMFDVLEHIQDDAAALRWVADHLEPGGIAVITVPALQCLWSELDTAARHHRRYTQSTLAALVPSTLTVEHITYFNSLLLPPIAAVRAVMRLLPRRMRPSASQLDRPPAPINSLLQHLFALERRVVVHGHLPLGVSIALVLRRRAAPA